MLVAANSGGIVREDSRLDFHAGMLLTYPTMLTKSLPLTVFALFLFCFARAAGAITLGQVDDFQTADPLDRMNWVNGASLVERINGGGPLGAGDNYLQVTAGGLGNRLVAQNYNNPFAVPPFISQWTGNYIAAGVNRIEFDLNNMSAVTLSIRIAFKTENSQASSGYLSARVIVAPGSGWQHFSISITPANLTAIGGPAAYNTFFANGFEEMRIINEVGSSNLNGDPVVGVVLGIDNIRAIPEPSTVALALSGALLLGARLRRGKRRTA